MQGMRLLLVSIVRNVHRVIVLTSTVKAWARAFLLHNDSIVLRDLKSQASQHHRSAKGRGHDLYLTSLPGTEKKFTVEDTYGTDIRTWKTGPNRSSSSAARHSSSIHHFIF
jgi:hypothetical protein